MVRELDDLTRKILFITEGGRCFNPTCRKAATDCAHLIGRAAKSTRWDTTPDGNCHLLCRECHIADEANTLDPSYVAILEGREGDGAYDRIQHRSREITSLSDPAMADLVEVMRVQFDLVRDGHARLLPIPKQNHK